MDTQVEMADSKTDEQIGIADLERCSGLEQLADAFIRYVVNPPQGTLISKLGSKKLIITRHGDQHVVKCLSESFPITQAFIRLEASKTLGLELRVMRNVTDPENEALARLLVHPDGRALVLGVDGNFSRSIAGDDEMNSTAVAFLEAVADRALVKLTRRNF